MPAAERQREAEAAIPAPPPAAFMTGLLKPGAYVVITARPGDVLAREPGR